MGIPAHAWIGQGSHRLHNGEIDRDSGKGQDDKIVLRQW